MKKKKETEKKVFTALSHLMDETVSENDALKILNEIRLTVDDKLIPAIEKIQYENKYELIDGICDICRDISLYLYFPELIDKNLVGFYGIDISFFCGDMISDVIPTFFGGNADQTIRVLNLSEKAVSITSREYSDLLKYSGKKKIDLSGILYAASVPLGNQNISQIYVAIPKGIDITKKYYLSTLNAIDTLVICAQEFSEGLLKEYKNISRLFVYGKMTGQAKNRLEKYCKENNILTKYFQSVSEIFFDLKNNGNQKISNNFCYIYYLENILYEIAWYLANAKREYEKPLADINDNLVYKDDKTYKYVKKLQSRYNEKIQFVTKLYADYKKICEELIEKMEILQESYGVKENADRINQHLPMQKTLLELILKMSENYKSFPETGSKERMRKYCAIYKHISGNDQIANIVLNDFLGNTLLQSDLEAFFAMQTDSVFFNRKKIDLMDQLHMSLDKCAGIILGMKVPLRSVEQRILGEYFLGLSMMDLAERCLKEAVKDGDQAAGELLFQSKRNLSEAELKQLADYGVTKAAYKVGKDLYSKGDESQGIKYLSIAASKSDLRAIKLLGDINYDEYDENEDDQIADRALHYYSVAERKGSADQKLYEKMGELYFRKKNYIKAKEYYQKSDTPHSNYYLGVIFENGYGCAANRKTALEYYSKAMQNNHYEAKMAYSRIHEKMEAEKRKNTASETKSYSSSSYTSNYSTSGW